MTQSYRNLTQQEIEQLEKQGCTAEDWNNVNVCNECFNPLFIQNSHFYRHIKIGKLDPDLSETCDYCGIIDVDSCCPPPGIYNTTLVNCEVGDYCRIANIHNRIANCSIGRQTIVENVGFMCSSRSEFWVSSYGNGVKVDAINEGGGRGITIHEKINSHSAFFVSSMRNRTNKVTNMEKTAKEYAEQQAGCHSFIGSDCEIKNCRSIIDIKIEDNVRLIGCSRLENGTICEGAFVGDDVIARDFIIARGAKVTDGAQLKRCYVGEGSEIGEQFAATDCFFSCNCQFFHGEAASIFAGPYSVSHHKSTLLIGMAMSFFNAGSGSNQSNHGYKLGPNNQGILDRGCKLGSSSYLLWPAHLGAFTTVLGSHKEHPDTTELPFSYLLEKNGEPYILPAANLRSVGTMRDADKWPKRDNRKNISKPLDHVTLELFNPFTISQILKGIKVLNELLQSKDEILVHKGLKMKRSAAEKGLELYKLAIAKYKAEVLNKNGYDPNVTEPATGWCDMGGLIMPSSVLGGLDKVQSVDEINEFFDLQAKNYNAYEWNWAVRQFPDLTDESRYAAIREEGEKATTTLNALALADAAKEYAPSAMLGYGLDPECENPEADFTAVRGRFEDNAFVKKLKGE